ncbi:MAG: hypothetical protein P0Y65_21070 [Candidatus Devosia phytovorans]|uniref:Uncharacterized protein n=1 Tax=Candidatus Devosia phytovorans TaxID=3121372 RepID=A0AAJ5VVH5_9HYPH|nr:hypothetical protein [Devosia sp.]WEK04635.1 MAG: hypothetical protein P0Y65_21070 [Devosia sp.]
MDETPQVDIQDEKSSPALRERRGPSGAVLLSFVVGLVAAASLGTSAWVYRDTQRQIAAVATDIAQFRLSLELFGRQQGAAAPADTAKLADLTNRLDILEENWRNAPTAALPPTPEATSQTVIVPDAAAAAAGDCLPTGTRFMVTRGDVYPVCGATGTVEISGVDSGFVTLADGTVIAAGGNIALPGSRCMIGVVTADAASGYAEVRLTC